MSMCRHDFQGKCLGFCHRGPPTNDTVEMIFKSKWDSLHQSRWTSYQKNALDNHGDDDSIDIYKVFSGFISAGGDLSRGRMTVEEAKKLCKTGFNGICQGFCHE